MSKPEWIRWGWYNFSMMLMSTLSGLLASKGVAWWTVPVGVVCGACMSALLLMPGQKAKS